MTGARGFATYGRSSNLLFSSNLAEFYILCRWCGPDVREIGSQRCGATSKRRFREPNETIESRRPPRHRMELGCRFNHASLQRADSLFCEIS